MSRLLLIALFLGLAASAGCADDPAPEPTPSATEVSAPTSAGDGLLDLAGLNPSLSTFARAVEAAGLTEALSAEGPFTVFAPSDAAFEAAGGAALLDDPDALAETLKAHVIQSRMLAIDVFAAIEIETLAGTTITVDAPGEGQVTVSADGTTATVTTADLDASNGVIHTIDTLL